jgi:hypothetical protein
MPQPATSKRHFSNSLNAVGMDKNSVNSSLHSADNHSPDQIGKSKGMFGRGMGLIPLRFIPPPKSGLGLIAFRFHLMITSI